MKIESDYQQNLCVQQFRSSITVQLQFKISSTMPTKIQTKFRAFATSRQGEA